MILTLVSSLIHQMMLTHRLLKTDFSFQPSLSQFGWTAKLLLTQVTLYQMPDLRSLAYRKSPL